MNIGGLTIYESTTMCEQFRFPRSKKMRIRRKWALRSGNFRPIMDRGMQVHGSLIVHPLLAAKLRRELESLRQDLGFQPYQIDLLGGRWGI